MITLEATLIYWYSLLTFAFSALFLFQGVMNLLIHRQKILPFDVTFYIVSLCFLSAAYSFGAFYLVQNHASENNVHMLMVNWITGSLINFTYIRAMQVFLNLESKKIKIISLVPLLSAFGALVAEILYIFTDINFVLDPSEPQVVFQNIFLAKAGGYNPHVFMKFLSLFIVFPSLAGLGVFLRFLIPLRNEFPFLIYGVVISLVVMVMEVNTAIMGGWLHYFPPLMFLSNLVEVLRISYVNQRSFGRRIVELQDNLIQSHKLAVAGDYFAKLSHEVANPLYAARSYFELLLKRFDRSEFSPKMLKYVDNIEQQFAHIQDLLSNVKDLTRPTQIRSFEMSSVNSIIETTIEMTKIKAYHAGVQVEFSMMKDFTIPCLRDQIVQVLCNLVNNGIEAVSEQNGWVRIIVTKRSEFLEISVTDSGLGVPDEIRDQIFETRFSTKQENGNGLGLSICKTIVENHHGQIYVNASSPNTQFIINLPIQ